MMLHIPGVLNAGQVAEFRAVLARADWVDGALTSGEQAARCKHNLQLPETSPVARELGAVVVRTLARHPQFVSAALPAHIMHPYFNRYEGGGHFGNHVDNALRLDPGTGRRVRTDVSSTLFLSAPDEYEGGELVVEDTYGTHRVKLDAGDLIVYPATSLHRVEPVSRGARLAAFLWTQSLVRDDWQRHLLYDLDMNIQALRQRIGDSPETVALTSHYHNLIRMWGET